MHTEGTRCGRSLLRVKVPCPASTAASGPHPGISDASGGHKLWKAKIHLRSKLDAGRPCLVRGWAKNRTYLVYLICSLEPGKRAQGEGSAMMQPIAKMSMGELYAVERKHFRSAVPGEIRSVHKEVGPMGSLKVWCQSEGGLFAQSISRSQKYDPKYKGRCPHRVYGHFFCSRSFGGGGREREIFKLSTKTRSLPSILTIIDT